MNYSNDSLANFLIIKPSVFYVYLMIYLWLCIYIRRGETQLQHASFEQSIDIRTTLLHNTVALIILHNL